MPDGLRELVTNPFMHSAVVRTSSSESRTDLPRNRGRLYARFVGGWMKNEEIAHTREYAYERVKEPLLAWFAKRMTAVGQTSLSWDEEAVTATEAQLTPTL